MCRQLRGLVSERWLRVGAAALCPAPPPHLHCCISLVDWRRSWDGSGDGSGLEGNVLLAGGGGGRVRPYRGVQTLGCTPHAGHI